VVFSEVLSDDPDPWADTELDVVEAAEDALEDGPPLFLVVGLNPSFHDG
jgi:hypothetical protein